MINAFLRYKTKNACGSVIQIKDILNSRKVLFALFTRYGDTIISLVVIREFVEKYPTKDYLILCPKQMKPYVNELLPNIKCISLNKRNWLDLMKIDNFLKKWLPDIGFNPWTNGIDSRYFLSYCNKYQLYADYSKPKKTNHYEKVRQYLNLNQKSWSIESLVLKPKYKQVLICPQSTDSNRSLSNKQLDEVISKIRTDFDCQNISIASMSIQYVRENCDSFMFQKTAKCSQNFIELLKRSDLVFCVDSAPLHISNALKKHVIAFFNSTSPKIVINSGDKLSIF
jgi:ADP-heptose:LPS heptosyltransferase